MHPNKQFFEGLLAEYFEQCLEDIPTFATAAGVRAAEGKLGRADLGFHQRREHARQKTLRALETIAPRELTREQHLDRLALRSQLRNGTEDFARGRHTFDPSPAETVLGALLRELLRADEELQRGAGNIRSLLKETPRYLSGAAECIRCPERVWVRILEETVAGSPALLGAVKTVLESAGKQPGDEALVRDAGEALSGYARQVAKKPVAPEGTFALGAPGMERRLRDELGLDYTLGEVESLALTEVERIGALLGRACARFGKGRKPEEVVAEVRKRWQPAKPLLELYRGVTSAVASRFRECKAVTFPRGDELVIKPVPEFLRALIATAAYDAPGAFQKRQRGVFWVNDLSVLRKSAADQLEEKQQHFGVSLTCAHEAYPGHHLQFVTANRHPRKWRRLFSHAVFYEGWTLWCEQMMIDLRIENSPELRVQQLHDALWRCHRILVDLRLQTGRYTQQKAVDHLRKNLGFTRARAEAEANWYTTQPGVPMSYWLGRLENERLYNRLVVGRGWTLRKFNDWLLSFGTIPQAWIEKYGLD
jgi:uncharacterized protein (DUF885 family)